MEELKRCPFCGNLATTKVYVSRMGSDGDGIDFEVLCEKCGTGKLARLNIPKRYAVYADVESCMNNAIKAWNTRWNDE